MSSDDAQSVIEELVAAHPEASDTGAGIRAELQQLTPPEPAPSVVPEGFVGPEGWNAADHRYPPEKTWRGGWRKLRRGAAAHRKNVALQSADGGASADPIAGEAPLMTFDANQAAQSTCDLAFTVAPMLLDSLAKLPAPMTWAPTDKERADVQEALARFYKAHPEYALDLPPGLALAVTVAGYALPRMLAMPAVQALMGMKRNQSADGAQSNDQHEALRHAA
ncbi:MAG TPA: hypothetical protein VGN72_04265 [Tepidisphaeraceae bacterium]|nr:hypothetical protein [Tepidisphaeraceae bacterium]